MEIKRVFGIPARYTFEIKSIKFLIGKYCNGGNNWVDPMSGFNSPAKISNDINKKY